ERPGWLGAVRKLAGAGRPAVRPAQPGQADASFAVWDAKYTYNYWRPVTAIRAADTDGNDDTVADPTWAPFLSTPNHPSYISGHSGQSGAAAAVLAAYFGTDNIPFSFSND